MKMITLMIVALFLLAAQMDAQTKSCTLDIETQPGSPVLIVVSNAAVTVQDAAGVTVSATASDAVSIGDIPATAARYEVTGVVGVYVGNERYPVTVEGKTWAILQCR